MMHPRDEEVRHLIDITAVSVAAGGLEVEVLQWPVCTQLDRCRI